MNTFIMIEIKDILKNYSERLERAELEISQLESRIDFCTQHNFEEEKRICLVKLDAKSTIVFRWRNMVNEIEKVIT